MLRGVVYRLIEYLASMGLSSIWKLICAISVSNILTVGVHLSSTPSISGPGSATVAYSEFTAYMQNQLWVGSFVGKNRFSHDVLFFSCASAMKWTILRWPTSLTQEWIRSDFHCILRKTIEGYSNSFDFIIFGNIIFKHIILSLIELLLCN